ncbi:MAG: T9SS type B sorting domain-containing protein [Cytophagaceae bacterium]
MKQRYLIFIFLLGLGYSSSAQTYSPCFDADTVNYARRVCVGDTVKMIDCSHVKFHGFPPPKYFWGDGSINFDSLHTYNTPGIYTIKQLVSTGAVPPAPATSTLTRTAYIEVLATPLPDFSVQICKNMLINVKLNNSLYDKYIINYGDGTPDDTSSGSTLVPHTYTLPVASHTISVRGVYLPTYCGSNNATATITPLQNLIKPDLTGLAVTKQSDGNGSITLSFNPVAGQKYWLEQSVNNNTSYIDIDTVTSGQIVLNNLSTLSNHYCYRIVAFDDCNDTVQSLEICSETITATPMNNQNLVSWNSYAGNSFVNYVLHRTDGLIPDQTLAGTSFTDVNVTCGKQYCYQLKAILQQAPVVSLSDNYCVTAISTNIPTAIQNLRSTVSGSTVQLNWDKPTAFTVKQYQILRSVNGGSFSSYATSITNSYSDNGADVNGTQYCYQVNYKDSCDLASSTGTTTCPVLLQGSEVGSGIVDMSWSTYSGCTNGVQDYTLLILNPDNSVKSPVNMGTALNYTDNTADPNAVSLKYQIQVSCSAPDINVSYSNIFEINHTIKLFIPDAFTPNGDGINDVLEPKGKYVQDFKMTIFNRWGEIVFYTDNFSQGWDGNYKGDKATADAYAYTIEAVDYFGQKVNRKGTVTLLR